MRIVLIFNTKTKHRRQRLYLNMIVRLSTRANRQFRLYNNVGQRFFNVYACVHSDHCESY